MSRFNLDPDTRSYPCCPSCYALYTTNPLPANCLHRETPSSEECGAPLWRTRIIRGRTFSYPLRVFLYQELKGWLARLLSRSGMEDIMDTMTDRAEGNPKVVMRDIWDAPVFRNLKKDGAPFVRGPPDEARYVFGLSIDSFNPFQSKEAKQNVSVTGIYLVCYNLPPHLRYLPENIYLVGVIPGPHKPSLDQLNHLIKPLVDELLEFWNSGVFFACTAKYPDGRLVRCALVPLVCDLPAARQTAGFGGHQAKFFCSMCKLPQSEINNLDVNAWPLRDCEDHKLSAKAWKEMPSARAREEAFKQNSIRWSELLELPYWDPIQYTVIDSMHNHYLGLLKHHCRKIWGMTISEDTGDQEPTRPPEDALSAGFRILHSGTEKELSSCSKDVLRYICYTLNIQFQKSKKDHLCKLLMEWRISHRPLPASGGELRPDGPSQQGRSGAEVAPDSTNAGVALGTTVLPSAPSSSQTTITPVTSEQMPARGSATSERVAEAERVYNHAKGPKQLQRFNIATLKALCDRHEVMYAHGDSRNVLAARLMQPRHPGGNPHPSLPENGQNSPDVAHQALSQHDISIDIYMADSENLTERARPRQATAAASGSSSREADQDQCSPGAARPSFNSSIDVVMAERETELTQAWPTTTDSSREVSRMLFSGPQIHVQFPVQDAVPSGPILGRSMLEAIHAALPLTELPSWVSAVPVNVGTKARGKLSADQWHVFCVVNLPVILVRLWGQRGPIYQKMLNNYMQLVTEVVVGSLLEMSEEATVLYEKSALEYLTTARELYNITLTPNQHNSLHIPAFLRHFGPLHSIRTFFSERMNYLLQRQHTNLKFGELELTFMRHSCRAANLRAMLDDRDIRQHVEGLLEAYDNLRFEDRRGTRNRESISLNQTAAPSVGKTTPITLADPCFRALIQCLNSEANGRTFVDYRDLQRDQGLTNILNDAMRIASVHLHGVSYRAKTDSLKDCNIMYWTDSSQRDLGPARILQIFSHSYRVEGRPVERTYMYIEPLKPLSAEDTVHDPYRMFPYVGGRLYYDCYLPPLVLPLESIVSHFARTPMVIEKIPISCIHVLSLDKSVRMLTATFVDGSQGEESTEGVVGADEADIFDNLGLL
ncbi:hypothetical protein GSI_05489 [Ganoderma sinense ZZ0214-1]|uniref:Transposase family Tnp2 protein n=1 Tax=Ganoderma sinense ZZ0214-1 TaxID=1077348 RepID=A0A2G8SEP3_9APHY|nr:hypothetical protein GSI_05489 [Ganoderma sinense ZZ0214-1]